MLDIKCINSSKPNRKMIDTITTSTEYSFTTSALGKGVSYFLESFSEPMTMTFKVEDVNGQLISISTDLQLSNISTTLDTETGNNKITEFTISNEDWFNEPYISETTLIEEKENKVQVELKQPAYKYNFKVNNVKKEPVEILSDNTIFIFNIKDINTESKVNVSYSTGLDKKDELKTVNSNKGSRVTATQSWIPETVIAYKIKEEYIENFNTNLSEQKIFFNKDEINEDENKSKIKYPISQFIEEYKYIEKNSNSTYINLSNKWIETPEVYQISNSTKTITISSSTHGNDYARLLFTNANAPIGQAIFVSYTTGSTNNSTHIEEFLIAEYWNNTRTAVTTSFKPINKSSNNLKVYQVMTSTSISTNEEDLNNQILYLDNKELNNINIVNIKYNYPSLTEEDVIPIIKEDDKYYSILSNPWVDSFSNMIEVYKYSWEPVEISSSTPNNKYIYFKTDEVPVGTSTLIKYKVYSATSENNLIPTIYEDGNTYEGVINNKNKSILKCIDSNNHVLPWKINEDTKNICVNKVYNNQIITIIYEKDPPYIELHCNNVKVECCFVNAANDTEGLYPQNGWDGIEVNDSELIPHSTVMHGRCWISRYITVSWNKEESNSLYKDQITEDGVRCRAWFNTYDLNEEYVGFNKNTRIWDTSLGIHSNGKITIPPLNGTTTLTSNNNQIPVYKFFKIGYSINFHGEPGCQWASGLSISTNNGIYYDKDGYLYTGKLKGSILSNNCSPSTTTLPDTKLWGKNSKFYIVKPNNSTTTYYISPSNNIKINSSWDTTPYVPYVPSYSDTYWVYGINYYSLYKLEENEWVWDGTYVINSGITPYDGETYAVYEYEGKWRFKQPYQHSSPVYPDTWPSYNYGIDSLPSGKYGRFKV